ncbi:4-oxalocrotonate tautomerase family protein, partial [Lentzea sp. NPDC060358]
MPFANLKVPAGTLSAGQKQTLVEKVTDLYAETFGDAVRDNTMVLVDEVADGG